MKKKILFVVIISCVLGVIFSINSYASYEEPGLSDGNGYHLKVCGCDGVAFHQWKTCCCPGYEQSCTAQCKGKMNNC